MTHIPNLARLLLVSLFLAVVAATCSEPPLPRWYSAARNGHEGVVIALARRGQNLDATDEKGRTALHYAAEFDQPDMVQLLIEMGADPNVLDAKGHTPADKVIALGLPRDSSVLWKLREGGGRCVAFRE